MNEPTKYELREAVDRLERELAVLKAKPLSSDEGIAWLLGSSKALLDASRVLIEVRSDNAAKGAKGKL